MESIYSELDMIIADHVGYVEEIDGDGHVSLDCADPDLYKNIVDECTMHVNGDMPLTHMSTDAQHCIAEWEQLMQDYPYKPEIQYEFDFEPRKEGTWTRLLARFKRPRTRKHS